MQAVFTIKGGIIKGIASVTFSPTGERMAAVCIDDNHMMGVWDLKGNEGILLALDKGDTAIISNIQFKNEIEIASVGPKHFKYWTVNNKAIAAKKGIFGTANNILICSAFNKDDCLVGAGDGSLQIWKLNSMTKAYPIHAKAIDAIYVTEKSATIVTGGKDNVVNLLDKTSYAVVQKVELDKLLQGAIAPQIRSASYSVDNKSIIVGTYGSEIYELSTK